MKFSQQFNLVPENNRRLQMLFGQCNEHLALIEERLNLTIKYHGYEFTLTGNKKNVDKGTQVIFELYDDTEHGEIDKEQIHLALQGSVMKSIEPQNKVGGIKARSKNQQLYLDNISKHSLNFGIGPAGTGKTFLAAACAVNALEKDHVQRIVLVRPAVEAGEKLGFLPGDLSQKVDPYLRPLYDALYELMGVSTVDKLLERGIIEVAPLAFMRGRTLNNAFIILDESQNTTVEQMKMFLTRIGFGSTAVITGDATQVDLPYQRKSGLVDAQDVLKGIKGISFSYFSGEDVVRHPIVQKIIEAYKNR